MQPSAAQTAPIDPALARLLGEAAGCQARCDWNGAVVAYKRAQRQFPGFAGAYTNASALLCEMERYEEAIRMAERALEIDGGEQAAVFILLNARLSLGQAGGEGFREMYDRAVGLELSSPALLAERGYARMQALDVAGAEADFRAAMAAGLDNSFVRSKLVQALLLQGRYREAWRLFGPGMALGALFEKYDTGNRRWDGGPLHGGTLVVRTNFHGFGDVIWLARFMPQVRMLAGGPVLLSVYEPIVRLLKDLPGIDGLVVQEKDEPRFDAVTNILELPVVLNIDYAALPPPAAIPLPDGAPAPELTRPGLKVGLAWAGNPVHSNNVRRSMDPRELDALADVGGVAWYGLQKPPSEDPPRLPGFTDMSHLMGDFMDTAQIVRRLDMVATVDTSVLHLAATLGVPTMALVPHLPEFRWNLGEATPWYPAVKLLRQPARGDWAGAVERLKAEIGRRTRAASPPGPRLAPGELL